MASKTKSAKQKADVAATEERLVRYEKRIDAKLKVLLSRDKAEGALTKHVGGFADFLREQSVVGLAIGLVIGTQVKQVVDQIVNNFINPLVGLILPGTGTLTEKTFTVHLGEKVGTFGWGAVANTLLSFIIVAVLVFYAFKALKLDRLAKKKEEKEEEKAPAKKGKQKAKGKK